MFEAGLESLMTGNAALLATISGSPQPVLLLEQTTYPVLTYRVVTGHQEYTFEAKQTQERLVQFDAWADTDTGYLACKQVLLALRNLLDAYQGTLNDGTRVLCCFRENTIDDWEFDGRCWRITQEYRFLIVEAA
jgi:hypothetical protein